VPLLLTLAIPAVYAHAIVVSSWPTAGSAVSGHELPVELRFNSRIDPRRSRLDLVTEGGTAI